MEESLEVYRIWDRDSNLLKKGFDCEPVYNQRIMKNI